MITLPGPSGRVTGRVDWAAAAADSAGVAAGFVTVTGAVPPASSAYAAKVSLGVPPKKAPPLAAMIATYCLPSLPW